MKINQLKIGIILSYITTGLNIIINLVYTPIIIHLLGQSEYGIYTLVGSIVSYLNLFSLGFSGAYLRFYSRYKTNNDERGIASLNGMFLMVFTLMSVFSLICGILLTQFPREVFGSKLNIQELKLAQKLMYVLVINISVNIFSSLFDSIVSAHEKFIFQRFVNLMGVIFNPLIAFPLLIIGYRSIAIVIVTTGITIIKLLINIFYCVKKLKVKFLFQNFKFGLLKEIASFSFFIFINMIIDRINWSVDNFILGRVSGSRAVAIYGVGSQINLLYLSFSNTISSVFAPRVNQIAAKNSKNMNDHFTTLMTKVGRVQFVVLSLISSGFFFFGKYFITHIFAGPEYSESYVVALLLILPATIPLIQNIGIEVQKSLNKHQFRSIVYFVMAIFNIIISIPLAKKYGPIGAAMGTAIGMIFANGIIMNIHYHKHIGINMIYFWKSILSLSKGLILPIIFGIIVIKNINFNVINFSILILVYICIYFVSMFFWGFNDEEKKTILEPTKKLKI